MRTSKVLAIAVIIFAAICVLDAQTSVLHEEFEGAFPPPGWSTSQSQGNNKWNSNTYWGRPNYTPGADGKCADNDDASPPNQSRTGNNRLTSPTFDATYYETVWLAWDVDWYPAPGEVNLEAYVQVYNGTAWATVMNYPVSRTTRRDSVNISAQCANKSTGRVRFVYNETSGGVISNWYEVDDVDVWASNYNPPPPPDTLDLAISAINRPYATELPDVAFTPSCEVYNNLDTTAHATVRCEINISGNPVPSYTDEHTNYACAPGNTTVDFASFTPSANMTYVAKFTVEHPDDPYPLNNTMSKTFTTADEDVTPYQMDLPQDPQGGPFPPTAWYAERAGKRMEGVFLCCQIDDLNDGDVTIYTDTLEPIEIDQFDTIQGVFDTAFLSIGTYEIEFRAINFTFHNISRPPLVDTFDYLGIVEEPVDDGFWMETFSPDPYSSIATVRFYLGSMSNVSLRVYDASGSMVAVLADRWFTAGEHSVRWVATNAASGVYFVRLQTPDVSAVRKVTILE